MMPIRLLVSDLAGTLIDFGSRAPAGAFIELFRRHGVQVSEAEARAPMGQHKRDHIRAMLAVPGLAMRWRAIHGNDPDEGVVEALFQEFLPLQLAILPDFGDMVPGAVASMATLRARGLRLAVTTGYNRAMTDLVLADAARQGFVPDASCCASEVPAGRPAPWMILRMMEACGIYPPRDVLSLGDTVADVEAGANAGVHSWAVAGSGNECGLSHPEYLALSARERQDRLRAASERLRAAGAERVLATIADLPAALETPL